MWWKIYFWGYAFLTLVGLLALLPQVSTFNLASWEAIVESLLLLLGTYAFVYKKKMLSKDIWKGIFIVILVIWVLQLITYANAIPSLTPYLAILKTNIPQSYIGVALTVVISIPELYAIYKLGYTKKLI